MKTVSIIYAKSPRCTLISHLLKAASYPCKREKKEVESNNKRKTNEWRKKKTDIPPLTNINCSRLMK